MNQTLATALELLRHGISVVPVMADGSKRPQGAWKQYQEHLADPSQLEDWFPAGGTAGIGVVTGKVSGNLEMTEIEGAAAAKIPELAALAHDSGLGELWNRLCQGWLEQSPAGGYHWFYRLDTDVPGNTKIAHNAAKEVLAETRGEGGYTVTAPSNGTVHPNGGRWVLLAGGPGSIPVLTAVEREDFHTILATLSERPPAAPEKPRENIPEKIPGGGLSPGDDFENKTDWADILTGWTLVHTRGQERFWRRPGKPGPGWSATTGYAEDRDRLYMFTSSTDFEQDKPYTKFGAYALLNFGGDHKAAAAKLRQQGYGEPMPLERPITLKPFTPDAHAHQDDQHAHQPDTEGTLALATVHQLPVTHLTSLTDDGNAELLVLRHGDAHRYAAGYGKWLQWTEGRWQAQYDAAPITQHARETIHSIDDQGKEALRNHKQRSLSRRSIEAAVALAKNDPSIRVNIDELDAHPYELNTPSGIINLRDGTLGPHDRWKFHTKLTAAHYKPGAAAPGWDTFLRTTFNGDEEMIAYIRRLAGYAAIGEVTQHILPFLFGPGGNGKSVFLEVLMAVLGDYATSAPANFLMAGREHHETEIARLTGCRLVVCSEINQGARFDEAKVKLLTGGDRLTAHFMHKDHFTFTPTHTLFLMGNHQPSVGAGGEAFWRRLRLVPFTHTISDTERIDGLARNLIRHESSGILNWIVQGAIDATANGLREPGSVLAATHTYAEEEDALARFLADKCTLGPGSAFRVDTAIMRSAYETWCREQGEPALTPQQFGREIKNRHGIEQARSNGHRWYTGITIFANEPDPEDHWSRR